MHLRVREVYFARNFCGGLKATLLGRFQVFGNLDREIDATPSKGLLWANKGRILASTLQDDDQPPRSVRALHQNLLDIGSAAGAADDARERVAVEFSFL